MIDPNQFADWVSADARQAFAQDASGPAAPIDLAGQRLHYDAFNQRMLDAALARYSVDVSDCTIGGVRVHVVTAQGGPFHPGALICLHGGAFMWGAGAGALLEAVPLAVATGMTVFAVDYRLAPEHTFPAAVDDVLAVYAALLKSRSAHGIGVYGCSAGGMLTAQLVARLAHEGIAVPDAAAMLHGTGIDFAGDLAATAAAFDLRGQSGPAPRAEHLPYFSSADLHDPLVLPGNDPATLAKFPPSLLVSGTRDFAASACSVMHRRLLAAGVEAQFVLFDGMWHAHHMAVALPESQETFALLGAFFKHHLR